MSTAAAADSEEKRIELVVSSHDRRPSSLHSHHCDPDVTIAIRPRYQHPPLLLDVANDARSLIWQYMDNRSAVQYLSTCKQLHALYHSFPLVERVSLTQLRSIPRVATFLNTTKSSKTLGCPRWLWAGCWLQWLCLACCVSIGLVIAAAATRSAFLLVYLCLSVGITVLVKLLWSCFPQRTRCCDEGRRLTRYCKPRPMPRIVRLAAWSEARLVAYLQHVVQASVADSSDSLHRWRLPSSLRRLMLSVHVHGELQAGILPSRLSLLQLINVRSTVTLEAGLCPDALRTLVLLYERVLHLPNGPPAVSPFVQPVAAGVLPSQLQRLVIEWPRSLADLALPASLKWLDISDLPNLPIPPGCLPAGLLRLWLRSSCSFDPSNLRGALPSSLQLLQLDCSLSQPLAAELLSEVPQLETLDLGSSYSYRLHAGTLAPLTQLRVLRVGVRAGRQPFAPNELPPSLERLTVVAETMEDVEELVPEAVCPARMALYFECVNSSRARDYSGEDLFNDMCRLDEQHTDAEA